MPDPTIATNWTFDPMPAVDGWFAVIKSWDPVEGMFADVVYANHGIVPWPFDGGMGVRGEGHAGPFATQEEAIAWADAHDPECPNA
jgi:hypothetical protein